MLGYVWEWTAQFPWSSDPWLMNMGMGIALAGPIALVLLIVLLAFRWLKNYFFPHTN
jgi:hypothetical protein